MERCSEDVERGIEMKLEPCPICGRDVQCKTSSNGWYKVSCRDARHSISTWTCFDSPSKAADAWNAMVLEIQRRAIESRVDADVLMSARKMKERIAELERESDNPGKWTYTLSMFPLCEQSNFDLSIIDVGHADKILMFGCDQLKNHVSQLIKERDESRAALAKAEHMQLTSDVANKLREAGRAEAAEMLMRMSTEEFPNSPLIRTRHGASDEYEEEWNPEEVYKLFAVGNDCPAKSYMDWLDGEWWRKEAVIQDLEDKLAKAEQEKWELAEKMLAYCSKFNYALHRYQLPEIMDMFRAHIEKGGDS